MICEYLAINKDGLAISGLWDKSSLIPEDLTLVYSGPLGKPGDTWDGSNWSGKKAYFMVDSYFPSDNPVNDPYEISIGELRATRDRDLASTDWLVQRHNDEVLKNEETSLSPDEINAWLDYRKVLRDITVDYDPSPVPIYPTRPFNSQGLKVF